MNTYKSVIKGCQCGREHTCPIKEVVIKEGAIYELSSLAKEYKSILLVSDENTYRVAGKQTEAQISDKISGRIVFNGDKILIPNEYAIEAIKQKKADGCDLIIGIGSGVINDLCKYVSHSYSIPYFIVATAPSMDGYASRGAALILGGMKVTLNAQVPTAIIADTDVLKNAPMEMILSGYGDIIGKYSCLADWKLSALLFGEYMCDFVLSSAYDEIEKTRSISKGLLSRDGKSVETLMQSLVSMGILMAYVGNSRPASGSEHHFSHYFEIVGIIKNEPYFPHGTDVFYSTLETSKIRDAVIALPKEKIGGFEFSEEEYEREIERVYGELATEVISLQKKIGFYSEGAERLKLYRDNFDAVKEILRAVPSFSECEKILSEVGMSYSDFTEMYGTEKIRDAYFYAKDLKDRYTVLWMYYDLFHKL